MFSSAFASAFFLNFVHADILCCPQTFRPIELKLLAMQDVDRSVYPALQPMALMRTTGEIVFVRHVEKEGDLLLRLYTQQGESLYKKNIKLPCDFGHRFEFNFLFVQILWKEYLVISCKVCKDIKLVDMETLEVTTAFSDDQQLGKMSRGWHKLFVEVPSGFLELDCSRTKFTKIREIKSGKSGLTYRGDICYIPSPHSMIVTATWGVLKEGGTILAMSLDEPNDPMWSLCDKEVDGKILSPKCVLCSSRYDALIVLDRENKKVWVLNPASGEVLQNIDVPELSYHDYYVKGYLRGSQLVIVSTFGVHYFSIA